MFLVYMNPNEGQGIQFRIVSEASAFDVNNMGIWNGAVLRKLSSHCVVYIIGHKRDVRLFMLTNNFHVFS
jgi:hypothetical protein